MTDRVANELRARIEALARQLATSSSSSSSSGGGGSGVSSVFGRSGVVTAQPGDYTAAQVGAAAASHTHPQADITNLVSDLAGKAAATHTHAQADVTGLTAALAGKSDVGHTHGAADIASGTIDIARLPTGTGATQVALGNHLHTGVYAPTTHSHAESDVTNLVSDLAAKEATANKNAASGYAGLGTDSRIAAAQARTFSKRATANVALSASATVNATDLDITAVAAGEVWTLDYMIFATTTAGTAGLKPIFTLPASSTGSFVAYGSTTTATTFAGGALSTTPTTAYATAFLTAAAITGGWIWVRATIVTGGAGTIRFGVATGASAAGNLLLNSHVIASKA